MYNSRFWKDIERCPYMPGEPGYDGWYQKDQERLRQIDIRRENLLVVAKDPVYLNDPDPNIRDMTRFIIEFLDKNDMAK